MQVLPQPGTMFFYSAGTASHVKRLMVFAVLSLVFVMLALPYAKTKLGVVLPFIPLIHSALIINDIVTSALLFAHFRSNQSRNIGLLSAAYLFTALITVSHTLSFPGLFAPTGLLGAGLQTTAWLYMFWHGTFPLLIVAYAALPDRQVDTRCAPYVAIGVVLLVTAFTLLATLGERWLPELLVNGTYTTGQRAVIGVVWAICGAALVALYRKKQRTVLDIWLGAVIVAWICDIALSAVFNGGRYDLGFYSGRVYCLFGSLGAMVALVLENGQIYRNLGRTAADLAAARERDNAFRMLNSVIKQVPEAVVVLNELGHYLIVNPSASTMLDLPVRDFGGCPVDSTMGETPQGRELRALLTQTLTGPAQSLQRNVTGSDGVLRTAAITVTPVEDVHGVRNASVMVCSDVTDQVEAEAVLTRALSQARSFAENTPLAVIKWDANLRLTEWNGRATELFGWDEDDIRTCRLECLPLIHEDDRDSFDELLEKIVDGADSYITSSHMIRTRTGAVLHCEWHNSVVRDAQGNVAALYSLVMDMTDIRDAMAELTMADTRKDAFLATLAHELRNPLSPVVQGIHLIRGQAGGNDRLRWIADVIERQTTQMSKLLDDLLDVARISRGKISLVKAPLDIELALQDALAATRTIFERKNHRIELSLPGDPVFLNADRVRITQVLTNLLANSAKYTEPGGKISVSINRIDGNIDVRVTDNGIGIEPALLQSVFDPFIQAGSGAHLSQGGLGIGLALVRAIVALHGGHVSAHSEGFRCGSSFLVSIPEMLDPPPSSMRDISAMLVSRRILIADSSASHGSDLAQFMRAAGGVVELAIDAEGALKLSRGSAFDIAVLNMSLTAPLIRDVIAQLKERSPSLYLIGMQCTLAKDGPHWSTFGFDHCYDERANPSQVQRLLALRPVGA